MSTEGLSKDLANVHHPSSTPRNIEDCTLDAQDFEKAPLALNIILLNSVKMSDVS